MSVVLIVDDQEDIRSSLAKIVVKQGYSALTAASGGEAMELISSSVIDLVFLDIGLPDGSGIDRIYAIKETAEDIDIVMLTGINEARTAVESLRAGAIDYIVKPFDLIEFKAILNRLLQSKVMAKRAILEYRDTGLSSIIGTSQSMLGVKQTIAGSAEVDSPVLITGETGTGKELAARAIHDSRPGQNGVFVKVDCGTLSAQLIESELFGHEKGAFTDAANSKKGLVEIANGGTLFLDEIGNLPLALQPKLLRLIEESTFRRVGGIKDIRVNIRVIAATNVDIDAQIAQGAFRQDLYYRLNVIPLCLPPLRDRGRDILLLADFFLHQLQNDLKKHFAGFTPQAGARLLHHPWRGNIRELRNVLEREVIFSKDGWLTLSSLSAKGPTPPPTDTPLISLKQMEQQYIKKVLQGVDNNKSQAARILGISRTTLRDKLESANN